MREKKEKRKQKHKHTSCIVIDIQAQVCTVDCCTFFIGYCWTIHFYRALDQSVESAGFFWCQFAVHYIYLSFPFFFATTNIIMLTHSFLSFLFLVNCCYVDNVMKWTMYIFTVLGFSRWCVLQLHFTFKLVWTNSVSIKWIQLPVLILLKMRIRVHDPHLFIFRKENRQLFFFFFQCAFGVDNLVFVVLVTVLFCKFLSFHILRFIEIDADDR